MIYKVEIRKVYGEDTMNYSLGRKKMKKRTEELFLMLVYLFFFGVWFIYFKSIPILFDSWIGYMDYKEAGDNLIGLLKIVFFTGGEWRNARYVPNLISGILIRHEWLMDLLNAILLTILPLIIEKLVWIKHSVYTPIMLNTMLFAVSSGITRFVYGYASVLYLYPLFFLLAYLCLMKEYFEDKRLSKFQYVLMFLLSYMNACFLEHISFAFTSMLFILVLRERYKTKQWDIPILICCIISGMETCRLFIYILCTGTRNMTPGETGVMRGIVENAKVLFIETWYCNPIIFVTYLILLGWCMQKALAKYKKKKVICGAYWFVTCIWIVQLLATYLIKGINSGENITRETEVLGINNRVMPILLFFLICFHIGMNINIWKINQYIGYIGIIGVMSLVPMILTSNLGYRISSFYVFSVCITCTGIFCVYLDNKCKNTRMTQATIIIVMVLSVYRMLNLSDRIDEKQKEREYCIEQTVERQKVGEWKKDDVLELPKFEADDVHVEGAPEVAECYRKAFCYYYGLDENTIIKSIE